MVFKKHILQIDSYGALFVGVGVFIFSNWLAPFYGVSVELVRFSALVNLCYGLFGFSNLVFYKRKELLVVLIAGNLFWAVFGIIFVSQNFEKLGFLPAFHGLFESAYVAFLAIIEIKYFKLIAEQFKPVYLGAYRKEDKLLFTKLLTNKDVMARVGGVKSEKEIEVLFKRALGIEPKPGHQIWGIYRASDKAYLGHGALFPSDVCKENDREILFYLLREHWGKGYAAEAAQLMLNHAKSAGFDSVWATVDSDHAGSIKTCEKIGMIMDRKAVDDEGEFLIYRIAL